MLAPYKYFLTDNGANFLIVARTTIDANALFNIALVNIFSVSRLNIMIAIIGKFFGYSLTTYRVN